MLDKRLKIITIMYASQRKKNVVLFAYTLIYTLYICIYTFIIFFKNIIFDGT